MKLKLIRNNLNPGIAGICAITALNKLGQKYDVVIRQIKLLENFEVIQQSAEMITRAIEIMQTYQINFWDSCIISNAEYAKCHILYPEDLNSGQYYSGIKIINPF